MNKKLNALFQTSTIENNNCETCEDIFFLPSTDEAKKYDLKTKTEIYEQLRSAYLGLASNAYILTASGATNSASPVYNPFAIRPSLRLNLQSEICAEGASMIGSHKVMFSKEDGKQYITIEDLAVPKVFDVEYFEGYNKEIDFKTLYSKPAYEFKPAKFEILNWKTMQDDGHILAILDQPLTCLHYGENNKYVDSYVRAQLQLLPDLMYEKALEMQNEAVAENKEKPEVVAKTEEKPAQFSELALMLIALEKNPASNFEANSSTMKFVAETFEQKLTSAYTDAFNKSQTKEDIELVDELANEYVNKFDDLVKHKRLVLAQQKQTSQELENAKADSQRQAQERSKRILSFIDGKDATK